MNKDKIIGFGAGAIAIVLLGGASLAMAAESPFTAWQKNNANRGQAAQKINEANFSRFSEMHKLTSEGKYDEAAKIRTELGLGQGQGKGRGADCSRSADGTCAKSGQHGQRTNFVDQDKNGICDKLESSK